MLAIRNAIVATMAGGALSIFGAWAGITAEMLRKGKCPRFLATHSSKRLPFTKKMTNAKIWMNGRVVPYWSRC